jgi:hypothetical protein
MDGISAIVSGNAGPARSIRSRCLRLHRFEHADAADLGFDHVTGPERTGSAGDPVSTRSPARGHQH